MEIKDIVDLIKNSEFDDNEYRKIINLCNMKINFISINKMKDFALDEIKNSNYNYLDNNERIDFVNFIKNITFINLKVEIMNNNIQYNILFEYKRDKYQIIKKLDFNKNDIYNFVGNNTYNFDENISKFIKENKFNFREELLRNFFIDIINIF